MVMKIVALMALSSLTTMALANCGKCESDAAKEEGCPAGKCASAASSTDGNASGACALKSTEPKNSPGDSSTSVETKKEGCAGGACALKPAEAEKKPSTGEATINVEALALLLRSGVPVTVLDARPAKRDDGRRIPGAKSLNAGSTDSEIAAVLVDKNALVVTYCSSLKCRASGMLAKKLQELGYRNVIEFPEGIAGWQNAGKSIEKAEKK